MLLPLSVVLPRRTKLRHLRQGTPRRHQRIEDLEALPTGIPFPCKGIHRPQKSPIFQRTTEAKPQTGVMDAGYRRLQPQISPCPRKGTGWTRRTILMTRSYPKRRSRQRTDDPPTREPVRQPH